MECSPEDSYNDLKRMKALCYGHIRKAELEICEDADDLIALLREQRGLDEKNPDVLLELLGSIERKDLVVQVENFSKHGGCVELGENIPEIKRISDHLKVFYKTDMPCYQNLPQLRSASVVKLQDMDFHFTTQGRGSKEWMCHSGQRLNLQQVVNKLESRRFTRLLIEGEAGCGKTVFTRRLAYDWATHETNLGYDVLFLLDAKHFRENRGCSLADVLHSSLSIQYRRKITPDQLWNYVEACEDRVMIVIDGIGELDVRDVDDERLVDLLTKQELYGTTVVATCRPSLFYGKLPHLETYSLCGFTCQEIFLYISRYLEERNPNNTICGCQCKMKREIYSLSQYLCPDLRCNPFYLMIICCILLESEFRSGCHVLDLYHAIVNVSSQKCCFRGEITEWPRDFVNGPLLGLQELAACRIKKQGKLLKDEKVKKRNIALKLEFLVRRVRLQRGILNVSVGWEFSHQIFRNFFLAEKVAKDVLSGKCDQKLMKYFVKHDPEMCILLATKLGEKSEPIFEAFCKALLSFQRKNESEPYSEALLLCLQSLYESGCGDKFAELVSPGFPSEIVFPESKVNCSNEFWYLRALRGLECVLRYQKKITSIGSVVAKPTIKGHPPLLAKLTMPINIETTGHIENIMKIKPGALRKIYVDCYFKQSGIFPIRNNCNRCGNDTILPSRLIKDRLGLFCKQATCIMTYVMLHVPSNMLAPYHRVLTDLKLNSPETVVFRVGQENASLPLRRIRSLENPKSQIRPKSQSFLSEKIYGTEQFIR
ncbi:uncharacterized protein LOC144442340 isoform X2 [Glandiceps talaboti]